MKFRLELAKFSVQSISIKDIEENIEEDVEDDNEILLDENDKKGEILSRNEYFKNSRLTRAYLALEFQRSIRMSTTEFKKFKNKIIKYILKRNHLFRQSNKTNLVLR